MKQPCKIHIELTPSIDIVNTLEHMAEKFVTSKDGHFLILIRDNGSDNL